jgi:hypothetical protein
MHRHQKETRVDMRMPIKTTRRSVLGAGLALAAPSIIVRAQGTWPGKPITIVVNFPRAG